MGPGRMHPVIFLCMHTWSVSPRMEYIRMGAKWQMPCRHGRPCPGHFVIAVWYAQSSEERWETKLSAMPASMIRAPARRAGEKMEYIAASSATLARICPDDISRDE